MFNSLKQITVEGVESWIEEQIANQLTLEEIFQLRNEQGLNLLMYCCCYGEESIVKYLLEKGMDPNQQDDITKLTPLHYTTKLGFTECTQLLLNANANIHLINDDFEAKISGSIPITIAGGRTALHFAAENSDYESSLQILQSNGIGLNLNGDNFLNFLKESYEKKDVFPLARDDSFSGEDIREVKDFDGNCAWFLAFISTNQYGPFLARALLPPSYFSDQHEIDVFSSTALDDISTLRKESYVKTRDRLYRKLLQKQKETEQQIKDTYFHQYTPIHPQLYKLDDSFFDPKFLQFEEEFKSLSNPESFLREFVTELQMNKDPQNESCATPCCAKNIIDNDDSDYDPKQQSSSGIYVFPLLSESFCELFLAELDNIEKSNLPLRRPNSMNNYGCIVNDVGFEGLISELMDRVIKPMAEILLPEAFGKEIDHHHSFVVKYKIGEDLDLKIHYDDSEITLNVCLGKEFTGGTLFFKPWGYRVGDIDLSHKKGIAVLHKGRVLHGANRIESGERQNLIVWCRSTKRRSSSNN